MSTTRLVAISLLLTGIAASTPPALATPFDGKPKMLVHVSPVIAKNTCSQVAIDCQAAVTSGAVANESGPFYNAYILAAKGDLPSFSGVSFTMSYGGGNPDAAHDGVGIDVFQVVLCEGICLPIGTAGLGVPGNGCNQYWDNDYGCRTDDVKVSGYFYLGAYSPDTLSIRPPNFAQSAIFSACPAREVSVPVSDLGSAIFSEGAQLAGCNPCNIDCAVTPVREETWSRIKGLVGQVGSRP